MNTNQKRSILCLLINLCIPCISMPNEVTSHQPVINTHINLSLLPGLWHAAEDARTAVYAVLTNEHHSIFDTLIAQINAFIREPNLFPQLTYSTHYNWRWDRYETTPNITIQQNQCTALIQSYFFPVQNTLATYQIHDHSEVAAAAYKTATEKLDAFFRLTQNLYTFLPAVRSNAFFQQCILSQTPLTKESNIQQRIPILFPLFLQRLKYLQNDINIATNTTPSILINSLLTTVFNKAFAAIAAPIGSKQFAEVLTVLKQIEELYKQKQYDKREKDIRTATLKSIKTLTADIQRALDFIHEHITILLNKTTNSADVIEASLRKRELNQKPKAAALICMSVGLGISLIGAILASPYRNISPYPSHFLIGHGDSFGTIYPSSTSPASEQERKIGRRTLLAGLAIAGIVAPIAYGITHKVVKVRHNKQPLKTKVYSVDKA